MEVRLYVTGENYEMVAVFMQYPSASYSIAPHKAVLASSKEFLQYVLEQLSDLDDISYRPMMGEYIIYYRGKIVGGIYDDRLLVKKTKSALELMPAAICVFPYEGAKEMLLVDEIDNKELLTKLSKKTE